MSLNIEFMIKAFCEALKKLPVNLELTFVPFYISFVRGTPILLQIYLCFYGVPAILEMVANKIGINFQGNKLSITFLCMIALTFNISAYLAEAIRGGVSAINKGEIEAAYSIGMNTMQVLRRIILPQAAVICLPNFCILIVGALQSSVLVFYVTLVEMNAVGSIIAQDNWLYFESFMAVGIIFWGITILIEIIFYALEKLLLGRRKAAY